MPAKAGVEKKRIASTMKNPLDVVILRNDDSKERKSWYFVHVAFCATFTLSTAFFVAISLFFVKYRCMPSVVFTFQSRKFALECVARGRKKSWPLVKLARLLPPESELGTTCGENEEFKDRSSR